MIAAFILRNKFLCSIGAAVVVALHLGWDHLHGGISTHYLLAREDLPGISNWWGLLSIPLLSLILISISQKLQHKTNAKYSETYLSKGFILALLFGICVALLWEFSMANVLQYVIWTPLLIAVFAPIHQPLYLLAFLMGTMFTFGGVLPLGIGLVLLLGGLLLWTIFRILLPLLLKKMMALT